MELATQVGPALVLPRRRFGELLVRLAGVGYRVVGPTVRDGAIVYDEIQGDDDLPEGWTEEREAGRYRLSRREDDALFGFTLGPHTWKKYLLPPRETLWSAKRVSGTRFRVDDGGESPPRLALFGIRSCDLAALAVLDQVLLGGPIVDGHYAARRRGAFVVAMQCGQPSGTCFCASMGTGPRASGGFDLALTELCDQGGHRFLLEIGTQAGSDLVAPLALGEATDLDTEEALALGAAAARTMGRSLDPAGLPELLFSSLESQKWNAIGRRCLACGSCTASCPTCFCTTVEDGTDLSGEEAVRERRWDSCFSRSFSHLHGGCVRGTIGARYRQWLTHKLGGWVEQFGTSGCVGCGRCITWCPAGIDLTAEVAALRIGAAAGNDADT